MDINQKALDLHKKYKGKLEIRVKVPLATKEDLCLAYTPGVAEVCRVIAKDKKQAYEYTIKGNTVAVVTDGTAVLGLGNIGPEAGLPVMEGKCALLKEFGNVDAFPVCLDTQDSSEIISIVRNIAPSFGGINLEDISAPRCFEVEDALQDLGIPVFHDDQHGTSIVVLAALTNAAKVAGKKFEDLSVVINGAGAAGTSIAKMLIGHCMDKKICKSVREVVICDSQGVIYEGRTDLNPAKQEIAKLTNQRKVKGSMEDALAGADVFIGVSKGNLLTRDMIRQMAGKPIIFAMANPIPEIMPDEAKAGGAYIVGTGRSDFPNQINNVLAFPGIFRGALDAKATRISNEMQIAAAMAIADCVRSPSSDCIIPSALDRSVAAKVAERVKRTAIETGCVRKAG